MLPVTSQSLRREEKTTLHDSNICIENNMETSVINIRLKQAEQLYSGPKYHNHKESRFDDVYLLRRWHF